MCFVFLVPGGEDPCVCGVEGSGRTHETVLLVRQERVHVVVCTCEDRRGFSSKWSFFIPSPHVYGRPNDITSSLAVSLPILEWLEENLGVKIIVSSLVVYAKGGSS